MAWLFFETEEAAAAAEAKATANVRRYVRSVAPERLADDGSIIGVDAATWQPQPTAARTQRWALPDQVESGWLLPVPTPEHIAPVPVSVFMMGVGGVEVEELPTVGN